MSARCRWKLLAVLIVASALVGAVGWQQFAPKPVPPTTITVTSAATTVTGSQTTVVPAKPTEWIRIGEVKPVDYYLSLLFSNGTAPYGQLYWELRKLPDLTNATAVAKITYLALNATNPEVKEAFELMMKGGTPNQADFKYSVPNYNTQLQVLYWLACRNEFKKDDTLALALAMVNGFWVTVGDDDVRNDVRNDTTHNLAFLRETNEIQLERGFPPLEAYALEAKICLAHTSSIGTIDGKYSFWKYARTRACQRDYRWVRHSVDSLRKMRGIAFEKRWYDRSVDSTVRNLEEYFFFSGKSQHWKYSTKTGDVPGVTESMIEVEGEFMPDHWIYNLRFYLSHYLETEKGIGDCGDETYFMEAWCKSLGIATDFVIHQIIIDGKYYGHAHMIYFEPTTRSWRAYMKQPPLEPDVQYYVFIFRPPVKQPGYLSLTRIPETRFGTSGTVHVARYRPEEFRGVFLVGCSSSQMKQWLLYS